MRSKKAIPRPAGKRGAADAAGYLLLTSSVAVLQEGRAVVLLAAQPDPQSPGEYLLDATVVPERPLTQGLCLAVQWQGGRQVAPVEGGIARLSGIPAAALSALRGGDSQALVIDLAGATGESDALG